MDSQPSKRFRENVNSKNTNKLSVITSNKDKQFECTIPPLVSNVFLAHLRDVELLKTCRLVCSSWNISACRSLRSCSWVCVKEGAPQLTDLIVLLLRRSFGALKDLPSPFEKFHAEGKTFTDPTFINLVHLPNVVIESLSFKLTEKLDQSQLGRLLAVNKASIANLEIFGKAGFQLAEALSANEEIKLMSLKMLNFRDVCTECTHIPLMKNMLSMCKPDTIKLTIRDENLLTSLLTQDMVENLKDFIFEWNGNSAKALKHLAQFQFPMLRELTVDFGYPENQKDCRHWQSLCQNVSVVLEDFTTNIGISNEPELRFPCLKEVKVSNVNALSDFTPTKYPSLEKITYIVKHPMRKPLEDAVPHEEVESVVIDLTDEDLRNYSFDQDLMILLTQLSRQFPCVLSLEISMEEFNPITLADINRSFPNLTTLNLDGECNFFCFTGIEVSLLNESLELGRNIESIPRRQSILDFEDLKTIWFGPNFVVTPDMINHCLPRIPKLTYVGFYWNDSLSANILRDALGHFKRFWIMNSAEKKYEASMVQLAQMFPSAYMAYE